MASTKRLRRPEVPAMQIPVLEDTLQLGDALDDSLIFAEGYESSPIDYTP